jgi:hypothetical protein
MSTDTIRNADTFTAAELEALPRLFPEFVGHDEHGRLIVHASKSEIEASVTRYPSCYPEVVAHYTGAQKAPPPPGADPVLWARYPNSTSMFQD